MLTRTTDRLVQKVIYKSSAYNTSMVKGKKTIKKNARAVRYPVGTRLRVKDSYGCYTGTVTRKSDDKEGYVHISYDARSAGSDSEEDAIRAQASAV